MASSMAALGATMYAMASCRFVFIDFISDRGDFSQFYLDPNADGEPVEYRFGAGLYTWLVPFEETDWSQGQCSGYTKLQTDVFGDTIFEVSRIFGVLSVLGGVGVTFWTLFLTCISLNRFQIWAMRTIFWFLTCFVGFSFLLFQASLCQDLVSYQDESYTTECTLDQGGLVAIAASMLWCVSFLLSVIYIRPPDMEMNFGPNGQITNGFQERQLSRERQKRERQRQRRKQMEQKQLARLGEDATIPVVPTTEGNFFSPQQHKRSMHSYEDGTTEVQLGSHRGNHRGGRGADAEVGEI